MRVASFALRRIGLIVGAALFVATVCISDAFVFKIKITGNGGYLSPQIIQAADECGARELSFCRGLDKPMLQAKILALPQVTFCSVQRKGSYLLIDVRTDEQFSPSADYKPLKSNCSGELYSLVAVCGTPEKSVGERVERGDVLIGAYSLDGEGDRISSLAVGFAEIKCSATLSVFYDCDNDSNKNSALAAPYLYSDRVLERKVKANACDGGVTYDVTFTYVTTVAINMQ